MKKSTLKLLFFFTVIGLGIGLASFRTTYQPKLSSRPGINFKVITLAQAKQIAKDENKPLFVFAHASWCPTCKKMEEEVLIKKELGDAYNNDIVNVAIDVDSAEGHRLKEQFPIRATPTLFFFKPDGTMARKLEGFTDAGVLLAEAGELKK
jgi:thiol-disulfide isomerase/thioredoxin